MEHLPRIAVIGAGMAGIACARHLQTLGLRPIVFEKSRGIGGRLATRRTASSLSFDHGAQYFTAKSAEFRTFIDACGPETISAWRPRGGGEHALGGDWLVSLPGMNGFLKQAAEGLDVRTETTVRSIERFKDGWRLDFDGSAGDDLFDFVIVTAPAPQATALTPFSPHLQKSLASIRMAPCWALMLALKTSPEIGPDVLRQPSPDIAWLARNSGKPGRSCADETWVAHADPAWSQDNLELEKDAVLLHLVTAALACLGSEGSEVMYSDVHRWRFAKVEQPLGEPFLRDETGTVFVCGDGCLGPRVESAYLSGLAAAAVIGRLEL
ncbi:MAG: NAD(P)-binding protein [Alphaproteobacteria bacterium]|nr:NAD(P)-binding protein [Alphaproteobacteria bacterium]